MENGLGLNPHASKVPAVLNQDTIVVRPLSYRMPNTMDPPNRLAANIVYIFPVVFYSPSYLNFRCFTTWIPNCPTNVTRATSVKVFKWPNVSSIMARPDGLDPTSLVILLIVDHLKKYSMEKEPVTVPLTDVR